MTTSPGTVHNATKDEERTQYRAGSSRSHSSAPVTCRTSHSRLTLEDNQLDELPSEPHKQHLGFLGGILLRRGQIKDGGRPSSGCSIMRSMVSAERSKEA